MIKRPTIRLRVKTNKYIDMVVAIEADKTMRDLAHRVLNCFHQLADQHVSCPPKRRDLIVSALKIDDFYISKSQVVGNMLNDDDEIVCILSKAKPKFPNYPKCVKIQATRKVHWIAPEENLHKNKVNAQNEVNQINLNNNYDLNKEARKSKKQLKKQKKKLKMQQQKMSRFNLLQSVTVNPASFTIFKNDKEQVQKQGSQKRQQQNNIQKENFIVDNELWVINKSTENKISERAQQAQRNRKKEQMEFSHKQIPENENIQNYLDTTVSLKLKNDKKNEDDQNLSIETKKQEHVQTKPNTKVQEDKKKKNNNVKSILDILSKASQEKQKKNKKKEKKQQKIEKSQKVQKMQQVSNERTIANNSQPNQNGNCLKIVKVQNGSGNKIASPKVTFHNSPLMSPQSININSPKRKISNPAIERIQLQGPSTFQLNSQKPAKKQIQKAQKVQLGEQKKEAPTACPASNIIVQEDSQQSYQKENSSGIQVQAESINSKLAALNSKISKYKLQFFNHSESENDEQ